MDDALDLVLQPTVHVSDLLGTVALLAALGAQVVQGTAEGDWVQLQLGGARVGLLARPTPAKAAGPSS